MIVSKASIEKLAQIEAEHYQSGGCFHDIPPQRYTVPWMQELFEQHFWLKLNELDSEPVTYTATALTKHDFRALRVLNAVASIPEGKTLLVVCASTKSKKELVQAFSKHADMTSFTTCTARIRGRVVRFTLPVVTNFKGLEFNKFFIDESTSVPFECKQELMVRARQ